MQSSFFLGVIRPKSAYIFTIPKDEMAVLVEGHGQHGGHNSTETYVYWRNSFDDLWNDLSKYSGLDKFHEYINRKGDIDETHN